jgi:hypothetical protein
LPGRWRVGLGSCTGGWRGKAVQSAACTAYTGSTVCCLYCICRQYSLLHVLSILTAVQSAACTAETGITVCCLFCQDSQLWSGSICG